MRVLVLLVLYVFRLGNARIGCKGITGRKVDWFIVYKLPKGVNGANNGLEFMYADAENSNLTMSRKLIDDESVAVGATLEQIYRKEPTSFRLMYSDDGPHSRADSYRGHAKGVALFDSVTGFWMMHSAPNFPSTSSFSYPASAVRFAQTFICVTLKTDSLSVIGNQWRYIQATPFDHNLPAKFAKKYPVLRNVIAKQSLPKSATVFTSSQEIRTEDGLLLHSFAKHKKFNKDLWRDLVAPQMRTSLAVQSWLNGGGDDLHTSCQKDYNIYDIRSISMPGLVFNSSKDHSKWAVSEEKRIPLVCIGDINRQKSQFRRGGGALCLENVNLWKTYRKALNTFEPCNINGKDSWSYIILFFTILVGNRIV